MNGLNSRWLPVELTEGTTNTHYLCRVTSVLSASYSQNAKIAQSSWMEQRLRFGLEGAETETLHLVAGAGRFQLGLTQTG